MKEDIKLEDVLYGIAKTLEKIIDHCEYNRETLALVKISKKVRLK